MSTGFKTLLASLGVLSLASVLTIAAALDWFGPVRPFRSFHRHLEVGMSRSAVLEVLERGFPSDGPYPVPVMLSSPSPGGEVVSFVLNPSDGRYDSEVVLLRFESGRLRSAEYHPD